MALRSGRVGIHPSQVDPITGMLLNGPAPGSISFEDLSDAQISNPEAGQTLQYNGTGWENVFASISPITPATLASLQDVMLSDLQDGDFISYDATEEKWVNVGEAPAPTYTDLTVTMYGAVEDTISFTDAAGISHSEVFASGQSSKSVTFKINPSGSTSITFTSAVAKDPDDLSADYSKSVIITDATTEIKVMPEHVLYWFGFTGNEFEDCTTANGWNLEGLNHNDLYMATNYMNVASYSNGTAGVGYKNAITNGTTMKVIAKGNTANQYGVYGVIIGSSTKNCVNGADSAAVTTTLSVISCAMTQSYFSFDAPIGANSDLHAMWYE